MTISVDGRSARWDEHRASRRHELVEDTLRAIRQHGPAVGMDEIAAAAKTSKTVIYRHFGDRIGLYAAVVDATLDYILRNLREAITDSDTMDLVSGITDAYLRLVERDPEIYFFVLSRPISHDGRDAVQGLTNRLGDEIAAVLADRLREQGRDPSPSETWGHGLVGFIRAATDNWAADGQRRARAAIVADVTNLFRPAFTSTTASRKDSK